MIRVDDASGSLDARRIACIERAAAAVFAQKDKPGSVDILAVGPERIRALNSVHRSVDSVTDVLSFPACDPDEAPADGFWGDIVLCPARAMEQARAYGHSLDRELAFLTVHGMLHLFGYDHIQPEEETLMISEQKRILERMGLPR